MSSRGVLRDAWALYRAEFARYVTIAGFAFAVLNVVDLLAREAGPRAGLGATLVVTVGSFVAYAALVHGGRAEARTRIAVAEAYGATGRRLGSVLAAGLVSTLGITVGASSFSSPGIYLAVTAAASVAAVVLPLGAGAWLPLPGWLSGWVVGVAADSLAFPYFGLLFNAAHAQLTASAGA